MKKVFSLLIILALLLTAIPLTVSAGEKDDYIKILLIGNSYSDDAADGGYFLQDENCQSMLYKIIKSMVGDDCKVEIGLCWSGGVSLGWHATMAKSGAENYTFLNISDDTNGRWEILGSSDVSSKYALEYTDWDAVVLQPYGQEIKTGKTSESTVAASFRTLEGSVPYMLDYVATYAPNAEVYLYQIFIMYNTAVDVLSKTAKDFGKIQTQTITAESYTGNETGKKFSGIIPVGTAVQNARSTYLNDLTNNISAIDAGTITTELDPMDGLLRDRCHLTFSVGRYIANLTFAEKLIPEEMRVPGYTLPDMRPSASVGELPHEYVEIAKRCVDAAVSSEKAATGRLDAVKIDGYDSAVDQEMLDALNSVSAYAGGAHDVDELEAILRRAVEKVITDDMTVDFDREALDSVKLDGTGDANETFIPASVRRGYYQIDTGVTAVFSCPHTDVTTVDAVESDCTSHGHGEYTKCNDCGEIVSGSDAELPILGHDWETEWTTDVPATYERAGSKSHHCTRCEEKTDVTELPQIADTAKMFSDVKESSWFRGAVDFAVTNGLMNGTSADRFDPNGTMTRAMLVTVLWRLEGSPETTVKVPFTDLKQDWYKAAVAWAYENRIVNGTSADKFSPNGAITREQMAAILYRFSEYKGRDISSRGETSGFPDAGKIHSYAENALSWAVGEGLIGGVAKNGKSYLDPRGSATRAQVATILQRFCEKE